MSDAPFALRSHSEHGFFFVSYKWGKRELYRQYRQNTDFLFFFFLKIPKKKPHSGCSSLLRCCLACCLTAWCLLGKFPSLPCKHYSCHAAAEAAGAAAFPGRLFVSYILNSLWHLHKRRCKPAEEGSPQYAGRGTKPEVSAFGTFNGCTFEAAADYPPSTISNIADFTPSAYPPDSGTACRYRARNGRRVCLKCIVA